ncbi:CHASE domain-containing protein [Oxalobacteraceae bacterium A2-2]
MQNSSLTPRASSRLLIWCTGAMLALCVGMALYAAAERTVQEDAEQRFENVARSTQYSISARIKAYSDVARGLVALFQTSDQVSRLQFHQYVAGLDLAQHYPAIEAVSYAPLVRDAERDAFVAAVRADRSLRPEGYPRFDIKPAGRRPVYAVLTYLEPGALLDDKLGVDIAANAAVGRALDAARDSGQMSASGQPVVVQQPAPHIGLGVRLPVYRRGLPLNDVAQRRAAYMGSVGIGFSVARLVQGAVDEMAVRQVRLVLYADGATDPERRRLVIEDNDRLLFNDNGTLSVTLADPRQRGEYLESVLPVDFNGTLWKAQFRVRRSDMLNGFDRYFPWIALVTGAGGTVLLYNYLLVLYGSRRRAVKQRVLLDTVLNNVDAHVYMKDQHRRYIYANAKMAEAMGRPVRDIIGRLDRELMPAAEADAAWAQERPVFADNVKRSAESRYTSRDGVVQYLWTVRVPVVIDDSVTAVIAMSTDVTELHKLKEKADSANRAKSDFLSNMSHEIRTPMNSIIGMAHLALKTVADARQRDYLQKIFHSGQHLLGIINDILDFSKIEAGKMELEILDFALEALLDNISSQLGESAARKNLELVYEIGPGMQHALRGDPLRLEQVLLNFVNNAIKFSENGKVFVRVRPVEEGEDYTMVRFEVEDQGIGMTLGQMEQLFQSFHQGDPSTTRKYGGTGLGLVISKQLVELMGGRVGVESRLGEGSVFWFTARLARSCNLLQATAEPVQPELLDSIRGASVLLVEDNVFSQQVGQELLEDAGATVCVANNGKEAIDLLLKERFDCVLMDVQMPVMDGYEATRLIRACSATADTLVIAMTANAGSEDHARCLEAGMDEFVTKPIAPNALLSLLARCMRGRRRGDRGFVARAGASAPWPVPAAPATVPAPPAAPIPSPAAAPRPPAAGPATAAPCEMFDTAALAQTFGHRPDKMRKFAMLFLQAAGDGMAEIDAALARADLPQLGELGHRIKSSARAVGAMQFGELCLALEQMRKQPDLDSARQIVARMHAMLAELNVLIPHELQASAPADA